MSRKKTVNFIYDHEYPEYWRDGLYAALMELSYEYSVVFNNLRERVPHISEMYDGDFTLGWGAFNSSVDRFMQSVKSPKGLCIAGVAHPPNTANTYDVLFYETNWYRPTIQEHKNIVHAFGINKKIYRPRKVKKFWDYTTVGAFASWKRQHLLLDKPGIKLAIGEIQRGNPTESLSIVSKLLGGGVFVSDMTYPEVLSNIYNMSKVVYIPADIFGGGERAVLEARACGVSVEVEPDNPKLIELLNSHIWNENYYAEQLEKGIESCL